jgi:hypothetical protein
MKLLTKEIEKILPPVDDDSNDTVYVKFFTPWSYWTWYGMSYDPVDKVFFGFVEGDYPEYGYFSLQELENVRGPGGLKIERDIHFKPCKLREARKC